MDELRDDIAQLEARIDHLREVRERCRKISFFAKVIIAAGAAATALNLLALIPFYPSTFFGAVAAVIGGIVLLGSNKTTWEQTDEALQKAEATRDQFIGSLQIRVVGDQQPTLH